MTFPITRRGLMLVLSSPSGAGKTSICKRLLEQDAELTLSISATTRKRRPGEVEGQDYQFMSTAEFETKINRSEFLEYAQVFGNYYGTPSNLVEHSLKSGRDVLFDIDWQGTQQLKAKAREDLVSIFILPPSIKELEKRLFKRAQDSAEVVADRMSKSANEMSHYPEYDYVIINHDLKTSVQQIQSICLAERLRRERQIGLVDFIQQLRSQL
ncbi:guanylate kinase [Alphaproteobacteria bacterium]|jgi:guanylate kinase|nr:guanylate kinase [Alphaproteobacteria bacterium]MBT5798539.1 guanylate kinase [Alphaproteobacteria bacterium]MDA9189917.1 guanylate kinase [Alphaproteobacteria bacterium]MDA9816007.1 guanylate kinase [Alphaproteobacteria bacterium]